VYSFGTIYSKLLWYNVHGRKYITELYSDFLLVKIFFIEVYRFLKQNIIIIKCMALNVS